ncbi:porin [Chitinasiproducens palmae]|uniref:Outer membrane protein (Porin) n=1 Tax=Chitinasiproducens palmae TaxID=1770053 RepID=A0A1H2PPD7_9BURK|nr:porin [Chitinasiproducens palmae]SDV48627.1 Outer membrane protein (porin) [Chitinasiproducens palmae]
MKRVIAGSLLAIGCTASAYAQSNVTLFGSLDAGLGYVNNAGAGAGAKYFQVQGNMQPDRWGLRGNEDLGGGLKATFWLENGFYTNTGTFASSGTMWNRQAFVGLSSTKFGSMTLGHQTPFNFDWLGPLSTAYLAQSFYMFHPGNLDELADTAAVPYDNSVKYVSPSFGGLSFGAMLGMGNTANFATGKKMSFGANYLNGGLRAAAVYSVERNRTTLVGQLGGVDTFQGRSTTGFTAEKLENMGAGASYKFAGWLVHALYTRVKIQNPGYSDTMQSWDGGASYQFTQANSVAGGVSTSTIGGRRYSQFEIGDIYALSKRTQLYANILYQRAAGNSARANFFSIGTSSTGNQVMVLTGIHHSF